MREHQSSTSETGLLINSTLCDLSPVKPGLTSAPSQALYTHLIPSSPYRPSRGVLSCISMVHERQERKREDCAEHWGLHNSRNQSSLLDYCSTELWSIDTQCYPPAGRLTGVNKCPFGVNPPTFPCSPPLLWTSMNAHTKGGRRRRAKDSFCSELPEPKVVCWCNAFSV